MQQVIAIVFYPPERCSMRDAPTTLSLRVAGALKSRRGSKGISQARLAELAELSRTCVANIELGLQDCGLQTFVNLAKALDVQPDVLFRQVWAAPETDDPFALKIFKAAEQRTRRSGSSQRRGSGPWRR